MTWKLNTSGGRTIYNEGGDGGYTERVGVIDDAEIAEFIVKVVNAYADRPIVDEDSLEARVEGEALNQRQVAETELEPQPKYRALLEATAHP